MSLMELKDRYTDLYENSPAMYFSLDTQGKVIECNQTMLTTLKLSRQEVVGHNYDKLLHATAADRFPGALPGLHENGLGGKGNVLGEFQRRADRCLGHRQGRRRVKGLGRHIRGSWRRTSPSTGCWKPSCRKRTDGWEKPIVELSERNRELDEFVYVVSHDLQEPLRTLIAFSGFLQKDYGDKLEGEGQEFVRYLVDASRRMRSMIQGLLHLSRAGKVIGEFGMVDLDELMAVIKTDLGELFRSKNAELRIKSRLA